MKKLITIIFCLLVSITINAQEHLEFMGVPMKGNITEFMKKLKRKGFKEVDFYGKRWGLFGGSMKGVFNGEERIIDIYVTPITQTPYRVSVKLEDSPSDEYGEPIPKTVTNTEYIPQVMMVKKEVINEFGIKETVYVKEKVYKKVQTKKTVTETPIICRGEDKFVEKYNKFIQDSNTTGGEIRLTHHKLLYIDHINRDLFMEETHKLDSEVSF